MTRVLKLLHTADWHIGRSLYGRNRYDEYERFLHWLATHIGDECIDVLVISGDVFDTTTPSNRAQELYYKFLCTIAYSCCRHVVIIAGNHDSPSFLNAPQDLFRHLNIHVRGSITSNYEDEVIVLRDKDNKPDAIVCAVPYLRDKDIRRVEPGESLDDKNEKVIAGIKSHYKEVCDSAVLKRRECEADGYFDVPIIALGHLFAVGGQTGEGVRDLYVGSLGTVGNDCFPSSIDYLALGHLHVPQCVGGIDKFRYSGSPIPMGYGEATQQKVVVIVTFKGTSPAILESPIPCFQPLERIEGSLDEIRTALYRLKDEKSTAWLEIEYTGLEMNSVLREEIESLIDGTTMEIRRIRQKKYIDRCLTKQAEDDVLDDLNVYDVFDRCLEAYRIPSDERALMKEAYATIITQLQESDVQAE